MQDDDREELRELEKVTHSSPVETPVLFPEKKNVCSVSGVPATLALNISAYWTAISSNVERCC